MKKVMAALFVTMCVVFGSIGMGPKEALADTQPILKQRVLEVQMAVDENEFNEELVRLEEAFCMYGNAVGSVEYVSVEHITYHGIDDVSFTMYAQMADGSHDTCACNHLTHDDIEGLIVLTNSWTECTMLGDWM